MLLGRGYSQDPADLAKEPPLAWIGKMAPLGPFPLAAFKKADLREKMRLASRNWVEHGFGAPKATYLFYLIKHVLWYLAWQFFVSFAATRPTGGALTPGAYLTADSMQRLIIWNLLFESCGFGCASGPLTGRFLSPVSAIVHWLWPGARASPAARRTNRAAQRPGGAPRPRVPPAQARSRCRTASTSATVARPSCPSRARAARSSTWRSSSRTWARACAR
jgi:hypothetical protein